MAHCPACNDYIGPFRVKPALQCRQCGKALRAENPEDFKRITSVMVWVGYALVFAIPSAGWATDLVVAAIASIVAILIYLAWWRTAKSRIRFIVTGGNSDL